MALINFRSTSYLRAFILYAIVAAIGATLAVESRIALNQKASHLYKYIDPLTAPTGISNFIKMIVTLIITFVVSIFIYNFMYFVFGWGGGMLVSKNKKSRKYFY